jgi:hypothetical protein
VEAKRLSVSEVDGGLAVVVDSTWVLAGHCIDVIGWPGIAVMGGIKVFFKCEVMLDIWISKQARKEIKDCGGL